MTSDFGMKRHSCIAGLLLFGHVAFGATVTVGPWQPLFQGVDLASGRQQAVTTREVDHQVLCLRIDLSDPDVQLFTTPHCDGCSSETLSENTSHFLTQYGLQVAINGGFFSSSLGPADTPLGTPDDVYGLAISEGQVVSPADDPGYAATLMFTTNKQVVFRPTNSPPASTTGMFTAISGNHALLRNGVNLRTATPFDLDPRTAIGVSEDRRYLYLLTIDGRQPGWSDGADFRDTGEWLKRFGAADGINVDGGGSTTMAMADCVGGPIRLNRPSYVEQYGRERIIGHNFGVRARPLPTGLLNLNPEPAATTCLLTWLTDQPGTTQVQYGLTTNYGSATPLETRLVRNHVATLAGLERGTTYFFQAISTVDGQSFTQACQFTTLSSMVTAQAFGLTQVWTYTTNNLDGLDWTEPDYDDTGWLGSGPGLLCVENSAYVTPKNTALPPGFGLPIPRTYYFRTHFTFTGEGAGGSLTFSNYVDDGAVFYLNGVELRRLRMPAAPTVILNSTAATSSACAGTAQSGDAAAECPDLFSISGDLMDALVPGDNVLAVEVHNRSSGSDLVFGTALFMSTLVPETPSLRLWMEDNVATLFWNGEGFTLQEASGLSGAGGWSDVPGPVTRSPFAVANQVTRFYRLRR